MLPHSQPHIHQHAPSFTATHPPLKHLNVRDYRRLYYENNSISNNQYSTKSVNFSEAFGLLTVDECEESASQRASEWGTFKEWETLKGADTMEAPAPIRYKSSFGLSVLAKAAAAVRSEEVTGVISSNTAYGSKKLSSAEQLLQHMRDIKEELLKSRPTTTTTAAATATAPASAGDLVSALKALGYAQPSLSRSDPVNVTGTVSVSDAVRQGVREGVRQALSKRQSAQDRSLSHSQSYSDNSYSDRSEIDLKRSRGRGRGRGEEKGRGKGRDNSSDRQKERQKEKVYAEVTSRREQHSGRAGVGVGVDGPGSLQAAGPTGLLHARGNGRGLDRETDYADGKCFY
jgi:hypothetical protein